MPTAIKPVAESFPLSGLEEFGRSQGANDTPIPANTPKAPAAVEELAPEEPLAPTNDDQPSSEGTPETKEATPQETKAVGDLSEAEFTAGAKPKETATEPEKKPSDAEKAPETPSSEEKAANAPAQAKEQPSDFDAALAKVQLAPHAHRNTRKAFDEVKGMARAKALELEKRAIAAEKEREELKAKLAQAPAAGTAIPKEIEEEVKTLRERVRELDIAKDPAIEQKYDKRITANEEGVIAVLKKNGFGMVKGEGDKFVENPRAFEQLKKQGIGLSSLVTTLKALDAADPAQFPDAAADAEAIRELLRDNSRLSREKQAEIETWKTSYGQRKQQQETQTKQQAEQQAKLFRDETAAQLTAATTEIEKNFPHLKAPPAPLPTDQPAIAKAKQEAIDAYTQAEAKVAEAIKSLDPADVPPEKIPALVGRINSSAIAYHMLQHHVLPKVLKELAAKDARIKALEEGTAKTKQAQTISSAHARQTTQAPANGATIPANASTPDALTQFARAAGINVNT